MRIQEVTQGIEERGKTSRKVCLSPAKLGSSDQSSCVAQGLRPRRSGKKGPKGKPLRGRKVKSVKYGGPLKDYS
jgi:hypothetical protein